IDELELVLEPGLNVLTGETGAGKSILLQALDLALGGRPDADLVRTGAEEAAVEALFANVPAPVRERLAGAGIPAEAGQDELLVRRLIGRGSRARAYVNGALAPLALLRDLAPHLLRVYGQDEHQALRRGVAARREAAGLDPGLASTRALLESALAEVEEAGESLGRYARELAPDANRLDAMEERLAQLARLKRKYAGTVEDMIRRREELTAELDGIESGGEVRAELEAAAEAARRAAAERGATLIFDEVDAGIGGAVAEVVGRKLRHLGRARQVLCITHLPLIAAFADHHVVVTKRVEDGRTVSSVRPLATSERAAEL